MDTKQLRHFKQTLLDEKNRLSRIIEKIKETGASMAMSASIGELSVYDNHPADIGDELFERSKDSALIDNAHGTVKKIDEALSRIEHGGYGVCQECGREISLARLDAIPWAEKCIECQREGDVVDSTPRPLEEDILAPPFHRTFLDSTDNVAFDGEDAWQAVARYGSSDTPQDIPGSYDYKALWANSNEHQGIVDRADSIPNDPNASEDLSEMSYEEFRRLKKQQGE